MFSVRFKDIKMDREKFDKKIEDLLAKQGTATTGIFQKEQAFKAAKLEFGGTEYVNGKAVTQPARPWFSNQFHRKNKQLKFIVKEFMSDPRIKPEDLNRFLVTHTRKGLSDGDLKKLSSYTVAKKAGKIPRDSGRKRKSIDLPTKIGIDSGAMVKAIRSTFKAKRRRSKK